MTNRVWCVRRLAALAVSMVLAAACATPSDQTGPSIESDTTVATAEPAQLRYRTVDGAMVDLTRGPTTRPIALWFWAPG